MSVALSAEWRSYGGMRCAFPRTTQHLRAGLVCPKSGVGRKSRRRLPTFGWGGIASMASECAVRFRQAACRSSRQRATLHWRSAFGEGMERLSSDLGRSSGDGYLSCSIDSLTEPLRHVVASELNAEIVEATLSGTLGNYSAVVSDEYVRRVTSSLLGALHQIYNRTAKNSSWQVALAASLASTWHIQPGELRVNRASAEFRLRSCSTACNRYGSDRGWCNNGPPARQQRQRGCSRAESANTTKPPQW